MSVEVLGLRLVAGADDENRSGGGQLADRAAFKLPVAHGQAAPGYGNLTVLHPQLSPVGENPMRRGSQDTPGGENPIGLDTR